MEWFVLGLLGVAITLALMAPSSRVIKGGYQPVGPAPTNMTPPSVGSAVRPSTPPPTTPPPPRPTMSETTEDLTLAGLAAVLESAAERGQGVTLSYERAGQLSRLDATVRPASGWVHASAPPSNERVLVKNEDGHIAIAYREECGTWIFDDGDVVSETAADGSRLRGPDRPVCWRPIPGAKT
jgi:hypothetical protein